MTDTTSGRSSSTEAARKPVEAVGQSASETTSRALLDDIFVEATVELARTQLPLQRILDLVPGAVLELEKPISTPLELRVDGRFFSLGEVVTVGEHFGLRISEPEAS